MKLEYCVECGGKLIKKDIPNSTSWDDIEMECENCDLVVVASPTEPHTSFYFKRKKKGGSK